ncbi:MAG: ATP-binding protein, partial [Fluviibacter sp.]
FDDAIRRIRLFSSIHRRLHDPDSALHSLDDHFKGLFTDLIDATGTQHVDCTVHTNGIRLTGETLTTLSLIATELMTNAIKHAFPDGRAGEISLYLNRIDDQFHFVVSDNGVGKAACEPSET